ncbi:MAG TPA: hypothetical protein VMV44_00015 [Rectinemataceae bacterium]|nr:hypothetical protein [Rectinemataceae bacterium]
MGLLARASREKEQDLPSGLTEIRQTRSEAVALSSFDKNRAAALPELLAGQSDILAARCRSASLAKLPERGDALPLALTQALGPSSRLFGSQGILLCFIAPNGDWDGQVYAIQLRKALSEILGPDMPRDLAIEILRFDRRSPTIKQELAALAFE